MFVNFSNFIPFYTYRTEFPEKEKQLKVISSRNSWKLVTEMCKNCPSGLLVMAGGLEEMGGEEMGGQEMGVGTGPGAGGTAAGGRWGV